MISKEEAVEIVKQHVLDEISRDFKVSSIEDGMPENSNIYCAKKIRKEEVWCIYYSPPLREVTILDGGYVMVISKKNGEILYSDRERV